MFLDFHQKNKLKNFLYSKITIGVLFVILVFTVYSTYEVYLKMQNSLKQRNKIREGTNRHGNQSA